jgi:hypothetical protein
MRRVGFVFVILMASLVTACGGDDNGPFVGIGGNGNPTGGTGLNTLAVTVDSGPAGVSGRANTLYTTVTICAPGSTTECQTIDHVQVDTGSTGFRVLASVLGSALSAASLPLTGDGYGNTLEECLQFADGYSWGTVRRADLIIGSEVAGGTQIQVIGDAAAAPVPATCVMGPAENTVQTFGANAVLGVGNFLTDCGDACASGVISGAYYGCAADGSCQPVAVSLHLQLQNPVSLFATDNNGVVIELPGTSSPAATVKGTMIFGISTQADNALGAAQIYTVDANYGTFITTYNGTVLDSSFIDAGSNAYFFTDGTISTCADQPAFYCPPASLALQASIQGTNGAVATIPFFVDNADSDFAANATAAVVPNLAGPAASSQGNSFDWGLPFFYGRKVYVAFEAGAAAGVVGPWISF